MTVKRVIEPANGAAFEGDRPEYDRECAIEFRVESREMMPFRLFRQRWGTHDANVAAFGRKPQTDFLTRFPICGGLPTAATGTCHRRSAETPLRPIYGK